MGQYPRAENSSLRRSFTPDQTCKFNGTRRRHMQQAGSLRRLGRSAGHSTELPHVDLDGRPHGRGDVHRLPVDALSAGRPVLVDRLLRVAASGGSPTELAQPAPQRRDGKGMSGDGFTPGATRTPSALLVPMRSRRRIALFRATATQGCSARHSRYRLGCPASTLPAGRARLDGLEVPQQVLLLEGRLAE